MRVGKPERVNAGIANSDGPRHQTEMRRNYRARVHVGAMQGNPDDRGALRW